MPTTYSPSLRLSDIGDGELAGTWGAVTDTNICTLLESAIAGRVQVAVTTANVTLTANNGADDQSRHALIELTGASNASYSVICPSAEKFYVVWNNTTGGFNHTIKTAAGTGVSILNGKKMFVFCDGTNVVEAVNHFTTLLPLTGGAMTGSISYADGTVSVPAMNFSADTNTGIYRSASDTLVIAAGGAAGLTVNTTTVAVPAALTVTGTSTFTGTATFNGNAVTAAALTCQGAVVMNSTLNVTGSVSFRANTTIGDTSGDAMTVNATTTFNAPVSFVGVPTFAGNVVIGNDSGDTLSVVSTTTYTNGVTMNGALVCTSTASFAGNATFGSATVFSSTTDFNGAANFTAGVTLGDTTADAITVTGTMTVGSSTPLRKQSAGSFISHGSSSHTSGVITVSSSAPSGGSNGDIWFQI